MATKKTAAPRPAADTPLNSQILDMIKTNISLAGRLAPSAAVDTYSKGNSPGPVDQYTKGDSFTLGLERINPAAVASKVATKKLGSKVKTPGGG